ncbi:kinase-like domain-containing protein [Xylaria arbuscula]|nr:kinase-like domain-containing protein [Xylaria arbuscula]
MFRPSHTCDIDAEPLHRYRPGSYHPILLGDLLKNQRYRVIQKIGWGGNSTTWVARDQLHSRNVALKVSVSEKSSNNEANVLNAISKLSEEYPGQDHPGRHHLVRMLDHFTVDGPNGIHNCLVLELLGPSVPDVIESLYSDAHLPHYIVRPISFHVQSLREGLRTSTVKVIDFGEAFFRSQNAVALFELVAGQPPFDVVMLTRAILVSEMMEFCGDELPDRWREKLDAVGVGRTGSISNAPCTLLNWLEDIYFDDNKMSEFTRQDIARVCELVTRMLKFEPSSRASAKEIISDLWFNGLKL